MSITLKSALRDQATQPDGTVAAAPDVLEVHGLDEEGNDVVAFGWVSATTNFYPPSDYGPDGHRVDGATPRAMTSDELRAYCQSLLDATLPPAPPPPDHPNVITF